MNNENVTIEESDLDPELAVLLGSATDHTHDVHDTTGVDLNSVEREAEMLTARAALYEGQVSDVAPSDAPTEASQELTAARKESPVSKTPRAPSTSGLAPSAALAAAMPPELLTELAARITLENEEEALPELSKRVDGLAKKVGAKAVNLIRHFNNPPRIDNYTVVGLNELEKSGVVTSRQLVSAMTDKGYSLGTARSQANQLMQLFPALNIAKREKDTLHVIGGNVISARYVEALKTAA